MKYYRVIKSGYDVPKGTAPIGKILPENFKALDSNWSYNVKEYVEISPEDFQEVSEEEYLKQEGKMNNKTYVKVVNTGRSYSTHPDAKEYGLINYHYWEGLPDVKKGNIYELVKEIIVNGYDPSYILKDQEDIEYLIGKNGCEIVEDNKQMEKKIIGYKLIKPEYKKAVRSILGEEWFDENFDNNLELKGWNFIKSDIPYSNLTSLACENQLYHAGVLDLWFEPVYEEKYNGLKIGDYVTFIGKAIKSYTTRIESFDKDGWIEGKLNEPSGGHYKYIHYRLATEEEIKKAQVPDITINGYKAEFFDTHVQFGCACIAKVQIELALDLINSNSSYTNRTINSITIGSGTFTSNQIKQIAEYYEK